MQWAGPCPSPSVPLGQMSSQAPPQRIPQAFLRRVLLVGERYVGMTAHCEEVRTRVPGTAYVNERRGFVSVIVKTVNDLNPSVGCAGIAARWSETSSDV